MRIMFVEDEDLIRMLYTQTISEWGYEVTTASNGREALKSLLSGALPDVLITDLNMPDMGGDELIRGVAKHRIPLGKIILFTAATVGKRFVAEMRAVLDERTEFCFAIKDGSTQELKELLLPETKWNDDCSEFDYHFKLAVQL